MRKIVPDRITWKWLEKRVCSKQVERFIKTFPRGTRVTRRSLMAAAEAGLDVHWFAMRFLTAREYIRVHDRVHKQLRHGEWDCQGSHGEGMTPRLRRLWATAIADVVDR